MLTCHAAAKNQKYGVDEFLTFVAKVGEAIVGFEIDEEGGVTALFDRQLDDPVGYWPSEVSWTQNTFSTTQPMTWTPSAPRQAPTPRGPNSKAYSRAPTRVRKQGIGVYQVEGCSNGQAYSSSMLLAQASSLAAGFASVDAVKAPLAAMLPRLGEKGECSLFDYMSRLMSESTANPLLRIQSQRIALDIENAAKVVIKTSFGDSERIRVPFISKARALAIHESEEIAALAVASSQGGSASPRVAARSL